MYFMMLSESRAEGRTRRKDSAHTCSGASDMKRVSFMQQRSHSCGDISPTETDAGWFDDEDVEGDFCYYNNHNNHNDHNDDNDDNDDDVDDLLSQSLRRRTKSPIRPAETRKSRNEDGISNIEQRRLNWLKQKQRSKSSDFSWRSGMWSPVEDNSRVLIIVPSPKRNKLLPGDAKHKNKFKLPAFFQMDSGSSYESYDMNDADKTGGGSSLINVENVSGLQMKQDQNKNPRETRDVKHASNQCLRESGLLMVDRKNYLNISKPTIAHLSPIASSRNRAWVQSQPKSHSLDSSFDDSKEINGMHSTASWRSSKNTCSFKTNLDSPSFLERRKSIKQKPDESETQEIIGTSPVHLFYTYNQSSKAMERKSFKGPEFLSKQTSERIRVGSEEIKQLRMKNKSPEVRRSEKWDLKLTAPIKQHLSPHQWTGMIPGVEKRTTFSQQKSFSYDIPSPQPKQTIDYRKKSEPIVGCSYRAPATRGILMANNQMFSVDRGGSIMPTRVDIQTLKSFSKKHQNQSRAQETPVEIFVAPTLERASPDVGSNSKRYKYCSQRSQSCETGNRNVLAIKRPSVSDQFLTASPAYDKRDYLTRHELQQFEIEVPRSPYSILIKNNSSSHQSLSNRRNQFLNQKSQSCEIAYAASEMKQILTQGKELRTLMGYPRLLRQLAKSDIGVEPIIEKDSSGSSKDAPEPPVPLKTDSTDTPATTSDRKKAVHSSPRILETKKTSGEKESQHQSSASKSLGRCLDASQPREENKSHIPSRNQETEILPKIIPRSTTPVKIPEGRLVSDGIVTWRRKLPEVDAAAAHEKFEKLMDRNRSLIEEKKLKFVLEQQQPHLKGETDFKRKFYSQQKSFSHESDRYKQQGILSAPHDHPHHVTMASRRHLLADFKKKSYSLDDKMPDDRELLKTSKVTHDHVTKFIYSPPSLTDRSRIDQAAAAAVSYPIQEIKDIKSRPQKKLALLHDMKALNDNEEIQHQVTPDPDRVGKLCRKRMTCRLSLGKLFSKLKPERVKK